jgi:hypothetical protein
MTPQKDKKNPDVMKNIFDRIVFGGEIPPELPLSDVVVLMVATVDTPTTGNGEKSFKVEKLLRSLIDRKILPAHKAGEGTAHRIHPTSVGLSKDHPWKFPPWADPVTGHEILYIIKKADRPAHTGGCFSAFKVILALLWHWDLLSAVTRLPKASRVSRPALVASMLLRLSP